MEPVTDIEFQVNQQYENEKGTFTVVSIKGEQMVIRWADGEEIRTDIDLQRRIQARRRWESAQRESAVAADVRPPAASTASDAKGFDGLQDGDFKESAYRTKWRGRDQLGGAVTRRLSAEGLRINSWAVAQASAVRWQDTRHRQPRSADGQAAFFVRLDTRTLRYGFAVVRPESGSAATADWDAFVAWLTQPENETTLHALCTQHDLGIVFSTPSASVAVYPQETKGWRIEGNGKQRIMETLASTVGALPPEGRIDVEISAQIDKADAVAHGRDIAGEIADLFTHLLPVYRAVLT